ncbi:hypothetical protein KY290_001110 [Solanum tuberosum]|uniref:Uncharacterized protein n=1 Tax=Solanum tuberosum TaxID=4113 RepID=A0ABQ7WL71_SOLTU|nr:hypothetical protein KY290_001110 [Solanum tuberosum]
MERVEEWVLNSRFPLLKMERSIKAESPKPKEFGMGHSFHRSFERERCCAGASSRSFGTTLRLFIDHSNAMFSGGEKH